MPKDIKSPSLSQHIIECSDEYYEVETILDRVIWCLFRDLVLMACYILSNGKIIKIRLITHGNL